MSEDELYPGEAREKAYLRKLEAAEEQRRQQQQQQQDKQASIAPQTGLETLEREKLAIMSREQLIALVEQMARQIGLFACMTDEEKAQAARDKLYSLGMTSNEVHKVVPALDKWFDRTAGKAPQSVQMTVRADPVSKLTDDQLAALLAQLPNSPMIIPPMPKPQDID